VRPVVKRDGVVTLDGVPIGTVSRRLDGSGTTWQGVYVARTMSGDVVSTQWHRRLAVEHLVLHHAQIDGSGSGES
jgi:hypothetical protein